MQFDFDYRHSIERVYNEDGAISILQKGTKCFITFDGNLRENPKICSLLSYDVHQKLWYVQVHEKAPRNDYFCYVNYHVLRPVTDNMKPFEVGEEVEYSRDGIRFKRGAVTKLNPLKIKGPKNFSAKSYQFVRHISPELDALHDHDEDLSNPLRLLPPPRQPKPTCNICLFECENPFVLSCGHTNCRVCLENFLGSKINDGHFEVKCFYLDDHNNKCNCVIDNATIKSIVDRDMWKKRERWRLRHELGDNAAECPYCEHIEIHRASGLHHHASNIHRCSACDRQFCKVHGKAHPVDVSCAAFERHFHSETMKTVSRTCTKCPGCQERIEKNQGCNHMTCTRCRTHFCYICGQELTSPYMRHYDMTWRNALFGCGGLGYLSSKPYTIFGLKLWRYRQFLLMPLIPYLFMTKTVWFTHIMLLTLIIAPVLAFLNFHNFFWESTFNMLMDFVIIPYVTFSTFSISIVCDGFSKLRQRPELSHRSKRRIVESLNLYFLAELVWQFLVFFWNSLTTHPTSTLIAVAGILPVLIKNYVNKENFKYNLAWLTLVELDLLYHVKYYYFQTNTLPWLFTSLAIHYIFALVVGTYNILLGFCNDIFQLGFVSALYNMFITCSISFLYYLPWNQIFIIFFTSSIIVGLIALVGYCLNKRHKRIRAQRYRLNNQPPPLQAF